MIATAKTNKKKTRLMFSPPARLIAIAPNHFDIAYEFSSAIGDYSRYYIDNSLLLLFNFINYSCSTTIVIVIKQLSLSFEKFLEK